VGFDHLPSHAIGQNIDDPIWKVSIVSPAPDRHAADSEESSRCAAVWKRYLECKVVPTARPTAFKA
jgi:hypothetical protein